MRINGIAVGIQNPHHPKTNVSAQTTRYTDPQTTTKLTGISVVKRLDSHPLDKTEYLQLCQDNTKRSQGNQSVYKGSC